MSVTGKLLKNIDELVKEEKVEGKAVQVSVEISGDKIIMDFGSNREAFLQFVNKSTSKGLGGKASLEVVFNKDDNLISIV